MFSEQTSETHQGKRRIADTPNTSFETISIDTFSPLKISNGFRYILTVQCELTKFTITHPIPRKDDKTLAETIIEQFILKCGHLKVLKFDRELSLLNNIYKLLNINQFFRSMPPSNIRNDRKKPKDPQ